MRRKNGWTGQRVQVPGRMSDGLASDLGASVSRRTGWAIKTGNQVDLICPSWPCVTSATDDIWTTVSKGCHYSPRSQRTTSGARLFYTARYVTTPPLIAVSF